MSQSLEARVFQELAQADQWDALSAETLEAKVLNWEGKWEEMNPTTGLHHEATILLDRLGFELHSRRGGEPGEYVSYRSKMLDKQPISA